MQEVTLSADRIGNKCSLEDVEMIPGCDCRKQTESAGRMPLFCILLVVFLFASPLMPHRLGETAELDPELLRLMDGGEGEDEDEEKGDPGLESGGHARLQTDPDVQLFLERARQYIQSDQYDMAIQLIQRALKEGQHVMIKADHHIYRTADWVAQNMLANLPPPAFKEYQVFADARAEALMKRSDAGPDPQLLRDVARRYILTSQGARAAYRLACVHINQGDFVAAARLLDRVRQHHSDFPVSSEKYLLRIAFVKAKLGKYLVAQQIWDRLKTQYDLDPATDWSKSVAQVVSQSGSNWRSVNRAGPIRRGVPAMPAMPSKEHAVMTSAWERTEAGESGELSEKVRARRELLRRGWLDAQAHPTTEAVCAGGEIWVSSPLGVRCHDIASGRIIWETKGEAPVSSARGDRVDYRVGYRRRSFSLRRFAYFEDRIGGSLTLFGNLLLRVEGNWRTAQKRDPGTSLVHRDGSYLTAYEAETGTVRWSVGGGKTGDGADLPECRFVNAPVPGDNCLLVAFERDDGLYVCGLDPDDGSIVWKDFLCSYHPRPRPPTHPVGMAVEGGEAYIATGKGLVFALNAATGERYWARTYAGDSGDWKPSRILKGQAQKKSQRGWKENFIIPVRDKLLVLPADAPQMFCLDRASGKLRYRRSRRKADYSLGLAHGKVIVAGEGFLRAHSVRNGKVAWKCSVKEWTGRPLLTEKYVLVPQKNHIQLVDARSGKKQYRVRVELASTPAVGNLYCSDKRLMSVGVTHTCCLWRQKELFARLNEDVQKDGSREAYLARGKYFSRTKRYSRAVKDLRRAYSMAGDDFHQRRGENPGNDPGSLRSLLLKNIIRMMRRSPGNRAGLIEEAKKLARTPEQKTRLKVQLVGVARKAGDFKMATERCYQLLTGEGDKLLGLYRGTPDLKMKPGLWAAGQLGEMQKRGGEDMHKTLDRASRRAYEKMTGKKGISWRRLYLLMRGCPRARWIIKAGRRAARQAEKQGKVVVAELILQQMQTSNKTRVRAEAEIALAGLYERQGWLRQAYNMLQSVKEEYPKEPILTGARTQSAEKYCARVIEKLRQKANPPDQLEIPGLPDPPYTLLWKKATPAYPIQRYGRGNMKGQFLEQHLVMMDRQRHKLICKDVASGKTVWEKSYPFGNRRFFIQGNVLFASRKNTQAISLITGKTVWENGSGHLRRGMQRYRGGTRRSRDLVICEGNNKDWKNLIGIDKVTGNNRWSRLVGVRRSWLDGTFGSYAFQRFRTTPQHRGHHGGGTYRYDVFDSRTGRKVGEALKTTLNQSHLYRPTGAFIGREGDRAAFKFPDGGVLWVTPWKARSVGRMRPVENSSCVILRTNQGLMLVDPPKQQIRGEIRRSRASRYDDFAYDPSVNEIVATRQVYRNDKHIGHVMIMDANTGKVKRMLKLKNTRTRQNVWINDQHILIGCSVQKRREGKRGSIGGKYWCIVRRKDGEKIPGVRLPRVQDISGRHGGGHYRVFLVGDKIVLSGTNEIMVYAHEDRAGK